MKIMYLKLVNFADIYAAMHLTEIEFDFKDIDKPIVQIYGKNRSGKTVLIQKLHPFSSINLNGDDRNDVPLIIQSETGMKQIVYEMNGDIYQFTHTYKPNAHGHTVSSSFIKNGEELNAAGGVNTFNQLVEHEFGINRYIFQFVINGTQLTSFAGLNQTQRKNLLNKAMGIDIYDKIHKLSTEDYRYTSKLITSLNNSIEYLLQNYGSIETLKVVLDQTQKNYDTLTDNMSNIKSKIDQHTGVIHSLQSQNIEQSLFEINQKMTQYNSTVQSIGTFNENVYDDLVNEQIKLNQRLNELNTNRLVMLKDQDALFEKRNTINDEIQSNQRSIEEYNNLKSMQTELTNKITSIQIDYDIESTSSTILSTMSLAQAINDTAREISISLNQQHLNLFCDMILNHVDISGFLIKEGSVLMDSEKEKTVITRIRSMLSTVPGDDIKCGHTTDCLYRNTFDKLSQYFVSYESVTDGTFTQYDLEQFEHAHKNYQTITRLIRSQVPPELSYDFSIESIITNIKNHKEPVNVEHIKELATIASNIELRNQYIKQLHDVEQYLSHMDSVKTNISSDPNERLQAILNKIQTIQSNVTSINAEMESLRTSIDQNEQTRLRLSSIKNIDIKDLTKRHKQLSKQYEQLTASKQMLSDLSTQYQSLQSQHIQVQQKLKSLQDAYQQYLNTMEEITKHTVLDNKYKIISEATSSTKGKPVYAIKDTMHQALQISNRLLNVMYDGEIELLPPIIDETSFTLPFRCGINTSDDIKTGSQSESTLLSLALSMSLASMLTHYNVFLLDECDGYLDTSMRDAFVTMLQDIMTTLKMDQMFIISHSIQPGQYDHIVHVIDISHD